MLRGKIVKRALQPGLHGSAKLAEVCRSRKLVRNPGLSGSSVQDGLVTATALWYIVFDEKYML